MEHKHKILSVFVSLLSSHRPKPAANSNDAGGMDESDLEKMKQVIMYLFFFFINKMNF